jgi:hypothetical protein
MKLKSFLILLFAFLSVDSFAQVTVDIFINGVKAGQYMIEKNQAEGGISYKKSTYKNVDRLSIQIKGKSVDGGYFRKVQVMGDDSTAIFIAPETEGAVGNFILTDKAVIKRLAKGKALRLFVEKTPANTLSKEPVKKVYIGTLSRTS